MKSPKHIPLRRCVVCRVSKSQAELIRFSKAAESTWQLDLSYAKSKRKSEGKGAWLCKHESCHKEKALKRFFRRDADAILLSLAAYLEAQNEELSVTKSHVKSSAKRIRVAANGGMNV